MPPMCQLFVDKVTDQLSWQLPDCQQLLVSNHQST